MLRFFTSTGSSSCLLFKR